MMEIGALALALGLVLAVYAVLMSLVGGLQRRRDLIASAEHAAFAVWGVTVIAVAALLHALVIHDFNLEYVASYSSSTLPWNYTITALWGGQKGSLLFWLLILSSISSIVLLQNRDRNRDMMPYVTAVLMTICVFFLMLLNFITPPFERLAFTPHEGRDLNPLLQNYWMQIHPPSLYTGYVSCAVPFAFAIAALVTGKLGDNWIRTTRRWTLFAWFFLSLGNLFGAEWAYLVLGWGGYWAWDPVENAAFMPWLTCTAFLHSVMIQEKKDMLKVWNMVLVMLTFLLTIFGTFLTRSGVISSVHSFTQSGLGPFFIGFLAFMGVISVALLIWRLPLLKSENELDSLVSRESAFLFNNLVLVGIAFAVFWGTVFPVISEWVRGVKITVGPPFFNKVNAPLGLMLLFLTGVGPLIAWRRAGWKSIQRNLLPPMAFGLACGLGLVISGMRSYWALVSFSIVAFVLTGIVMEYYRGVRARQAVMGENAAVALLHLIAKNRRRYGGYIIHIGIVMMFAAITGTSVFKQEQQVTLSQGQTLSIGGYTLRYDGIEQESTPHIAYLRAKVAVMDGPKLLEVLKPEKRFYKKPEQPTTEVAIRSTLGADLYLVLGSFDDDTKLVTLLAYINPLVSFLWYGGIVIAFGTGIVILPGGAREPAYAAAQLAKQAVTE
ncbi:MAG: heme lyase CcmF/NrfE family subunit [Deltaproteobacteria bacterium]|nr:heme lyase CcmF/NrfE family subunit [Deltaproteobacteria bacterium]MBI3388248.1 heme lyase CcmF/NrfE family subunit [Deltaproteobacteria bacterium]